MATETTLRYLKTDYQSHKDALLQRIRSRWPRAWNDFLSNSFGIVLVDIVAFAMSTLAFLINRVGGEAYISTMTLRESAVRLGTLPGYKLHNPIPATVSCEAILSSASSSDILIAKGTQIRASDQNSTVYEVVADYTIPAGDLSPSTDVATFSATLTGSQVVNSFVSVTSGSFAVDLVDTTIDLSQLIEPGQSFRKDGDTTVYTITALENAPGAVSQFTRMVLDRAYEGATEIVTGKVFDQRILLVQGQTITDRFVSPSSELLTTGYAIKLTRTPVIDNSISITVNSETWTQAAQAVLRGPDDTVFTTQTFVSGVTAAVFGDGRFGKAVPTDAAIAVTYRVGGGLSGNVELNQINTTITGISADTNSPVSITITNSTSTGIGGQDAETLEQARLAIPFYIRTNDRCVTIDDYQTFAQAFSDAQFGSVAYARATVRTENALLEGNMVAVYAWTTGPNGGLVTLSSQLKQALKTYLQTKAVGTDFVEVFDGTNRPVPLSLRFKVFSGFNVTDTRSLVNDTVRSFVTNLRPGQPLLYSNFLRALDEVYGVDTVNMATPIADLIPSNSTELFTVPDDTFVYNIERNGSGNPVVDANSETISNYSAQLPVYPLSAWSFQLFLGTNELTILPYFRPGFGRIIGSNLSTDDATDANDDGLPDYHSTVNLLTGTLSLWIKGAPGDLTMKLVSVSGYSSDRTVNVYIGYVGDNTATKRREIRSILHAWSDQLAIGQPIYARRVPGISVSATSIQDVLESIDGVTTVSRVALDTPANNNDRVTASDYELLRLGNIVLNNQID